MVMKNYNKLIVGDYIVIFMAYSVLAISLVVANIIEYTALKIMAYAITSGALLATAYGLFTLNKDKELLIK